MDVEDFTQVRSAVRQFVREKVVPREEEIETLDAIPLDIREAAADMGLFGYALPEEFGGLGVSMSEDVQLAFEFASYDTWHSISLRTRITALPTRSSPSSASEAQRSTILPRNSRRGELRFLVRKTHRGRGRIRSGRSKDDGSS